MVIINVDRMSMNNVSLYTGLPEAFSCTLAGRLIGAVAVGCGGCVGVVVGVPHL
jgi:hypothetical protein